MSLISQAAFRTSNGDIYGTGPLHDIEALPGHVQIMNPEPGFLTIDGDFLTRDEATAYAHSGHQLQSEELELDKAESQRFEAMAKSWLRDRLATLLQKAAPSPAFRIADNLHAMAAHMAGLDLEMTPEFVAARFLTNGIIVDSERQHEALMLHDGDLVAAALWAYGLPITDANRDAVTSVIAIRGLRGHEDVHKSEIDPVTEHKEIKAGVEKGRHVAAAIRTAIAHGHIESVNFKGKHTKGMAIVLADEKHYLLKPGSGPLSPARGITEETATQSRREVAFAKIADLWGLGDQVPHADLLEIDGQDVAAIDLLPPEFKNIGQVRDKATHILGRYVTNGDLFRWAVLDAVLGSADRHSGNIMVNDKGNVELIDQGSTFAGPSFDPVNDSRSYVPFYLRAFSGTTFRGMPPEERFHTMPHPTPEVAEAVNSWIKKLSPVDTEAVLLRYGLNPDPVMTRLAHLQAAHDPVEACLAAWSGLSGF